MFFPLFRCKFGQLGVAPSHFNAPHGFCIGRSEEIVVADTNNHRIQVRNNFQNKISAGAWQGQIL